MLRLRNLGTCAVVGLMWACSGESTGGWAPPDSSSPVTTGDSPVSPTTGGGGGTGVSPVSPATSGTGNPSTTSDPSDPSAVSPGGLKEPSGYTPVLNPDGSVARPMWLEGAPADTRFARLTNEQWMRSVKDVLRLSELPTAEAQFFENIGAGATDFVNDQSRLQMSNTQWGRFQSAAESLAKRVSSSDEAMQSVFQGNDAQTFVRQFGLRMMRRPLTDAEVTRYMDVFNVGKGLSGSQSEFTKGAGLVIETMLQSPYFLYRTETGPAGSPLNGYEKAAKLSLYILRTTPSDELLAKAERGELDTEQGYLNVAKAMLETDAAAETFHAFHTELYELDRFASISKSDASFTEEVGEELVAASEAFFERVYREDYGLREILTSRRGFVGPATAPFYGLQQAPRTLTEVELPPERVGFFTQLPYLMYFARDRQSYGILRGVHINTEVLCAKLPELGMPAPPLPSVEYTTSREYMEKGTLCGGTCHSEYINALGFSMENFDGLGRTRTMDNGVPVDTTGAYPFVGGRQEFKDAADLMTIIAENEMAHECYSRYVASYALGRMLGEKDRPLVDELAKQSLEDNASVKELVLSLVKSDAFTKRQGAN